MTRKRWGRLTLLLLLGALASLALLVFLVDPFEIYHRALFYTPAYDSRTQMYNNAGIARNHAYDSVIVGSSVTENCMPSDYDEALGGRFVKLSVNAGTAKDHAKMLQTAFDTHDVRRVVYGLDLFAYWQAPDARRPETPDYLYDGCPLNDAPYWFNGTVFFKYIPYALRHIGPYHEPIRDWMYTWDAPVFGEEALDGLVDLSRPLPEQRAADDYAGNVQANLQQNLLPFIRAHRETTFIVFFPPYSLLYWADRALAGHLEACLGEKALLSRALLEEPNVELYDFQTAYAWTADPDWYSDLIHYHSEINCQMASAFATGTHRVRTQAQIDENERSLREAVLALFAERSKP